MNVLLTQIILAAHGSEGEDTFWMQMLVIVILAVFFGIFGLAKARKNKFKENERRFSEHHRSMQNHSGQLVALDLSERKEPAGKAFKKSAGKQEKDLHSGMEILDSDFLLSIVEKTNGGDDEKDVAMRKLNFKELQRRGELNQADSKALKEYAVNKGNLYGKDIQCEAIKILVERTAKGKKDEK